MRRNADTYRQNGGGTPAKALRNLDRATQRAITRSMIRGMQGRWNGNSDPGTKHGTRTEGKS